jgi:putative ABC transport system ATP-binding protein
MEFGMISVRKILFEYPGTGFRLNISQLDFAPGETVAVVGPSGCGKTTLINLLSGILRPSSGRIEIERLAISELATEDCQDFRAVKMGLVFQEFELLEYLDVLDNILLPYRITPILELQDLVVERARSLAADVGLADKLHRYPGRLSQGERQRVAVCRAMVAGPGILFGDEPTGNLDPANRDHVMDVLFDYSARADAPLIVVTHDQELLGRFDRTIDIREVSP